MEHKKFEELIDLIINENEDKARELFHEIVVEKSREIYENIMAEDAIEESGPMEEGDQVEGMLDEIDAEETVSEDDSEVEFDDEAEEAGDELTHDMEHDHDEGEEGDKIEDLEDRIVDVEDELDDLMAKFEEMMGGQSGEEDMGDEDMGDEEGAEEMMEASDDEEDGAEAVEEAIAEAVQLQKVSVTHGDNGSNPKSIALHEPKVKTAGVKPVKFSGDSEAVPTGPKAPSNEYTKKEGDLPGAGKFKNVPGQKGQELSKAPAAKASPTTGINTKSPVSKG